VTSKEFSKTKRKKQNKINGNSIVVGREKKILKPYYYRGYNNGTGAKACGE